MAKKAFILGVTGQDGSYLAELLLKKKYEVFGFTRKPCALNLIHIEHILDQITIIEGDITDQSSLFVAMKKSEPEEIYNLACQSDAGMSWTHPILTGNVCGLGVIRVLEAARQIVPEARIFQASSGDIFGNAKASLNEDTRFHPNSPHALARMIGYHTMVNYRESYQMFCANGVMMNHESPRRGVEHIARKITDGAVKIYLGLADELHIANPDARREWGYAGDYVRAMWLILQQEMPDDYLIATGECHTLREFVECAFSELGLDGEKYLKVDTVNTGRTAQTVQCGDAVRARERLSWEPEYTFRELVRMMVRADLQRYEMGATAPYGLTHKRGMM